MMKIKSRRSVLRIAGFGLFLLFLVLFFLFLDVVLVQGFLFDVVLFFCVFSLVCLGMFLSGLVLYILLGEVRDEVEMAKQKESAVCAVHRYRERFDASSMDN